jgi:iron(III) transport system permease protein
MIRPRHRVAPLSLVIGASALLLLAFFGLLPLLVVLRSALAGGGAAFAREIADPAALRALANTILLAVLVTAIALPTGTALAWLLERTDLLEEEAMRTRAVALLSLPLAIPPYLLAMAWALLGNGRNGLLNRATATPWIDLYGMGGIVLVLSSSAYPFVFLAARAALRRADPSLEEAARVSGASPLRVLVDVTLPLLRPALSASAALVFVFTSAAFGVPYLLGSAADPPIYFLTTRIYQITTLGGAATLERAAALSIVLLAVSAIAQASMTWSSGRRSVVQVSGKTSRPSSIALGRSRPFLRTAVIGFFAIAVLVPIATITWTSFARSFADPMVLTGKHWTHVLARAETVRAFSHSVVLALAAGATVAALGLAIARIAKSAGRAGEWLAHLASLPYAVPGTVLAIGLILAFSREVRLILFERVSLILHLHGTLGMLLVAYAVKYLAFGVRGARAALDQIHPSLEEAARTSGASVERSFVDVVVPIVLPAVGAAFVIVALPCLSELTMSVLLFAANTETAGTLLFELQSYADPPAGAVVATLIVAIALFGDALVRRLDRAASKRGLS